LQRFGNGSADKPGRAGKEDSLTHESGAAMRSGKSTAFGCKRAT
jgi:hypothetical protein